MQECNSRNVKVKKAALSVMGTIHVQLGPAFQAVVFASTSKDQSLRDQLEKSFNDHPFDPTTGSTEWPKSSICSGPGGAESQGGQQGAALQLEVPKMDLMAELLDDVIARMVC
jgi:hypothetical protein